MRWTLGARIPSRGGRTRISVIVAGFAAALAAALAAGLAVGLAAGAGAGAGGLDASGVAALLDVMDALAALHRDWSGSGGSEFDDDVRFVQARARNESSPELQDRITALFATRTYELYFRRFRNVTPELVRDVLLDLPYRVRPSPGGIAETYRGLLRERDDVRVAADEFTALLDLESVQEKALRWVPDGDYEIPTVHLIYDSNAGSFTAEGTPFFNLYSERFGAGAAAADSGRAFVAYAEGVMAHEIQHALARPILYPKLPAFLWSWERRWIDRIVRGIVSEGVAAHCNPPQGIQQRVWEDPQVLQALVRRLEELVLALRDGTIDEEHVQEWYGTNFHDVAHELLRDTLQRDHAGEELQAMLRKYAPIRPDLEHVLGWWMVSRVSGRGADREATLRLLHRPETLFDRYNESLPAEETAPRIDADVVAYVADLMR